MANDLINLIGNMPFDEVSDLLSQEPYNLKVKEKDNLYLLKYDQINSPKDNKVVQQCRGIILEKNTNKVVCCPFDRFFNHGEELAADLDWKSVEFLEKLDGSLVKVYSYEGEYHIATNGMIDASDAIVENVTGKTFYDLWVEASRQYFDERNWKFLSYVNPQVTYMFELVHPLSKVVKYYEPNIYYLGTRSNVTFQEYFGLPTQLDSVPTPKRYPFKTMKDAISIAQDLPYDEEGYVAVDVNFNRIKIKSPAYVEKAHMKEGLCSEKNLLSVIIRGEQEEVLALFPEYTELMGEVQRKVDIYVGKIDEDWKSLKDKKELGRKEFARYASKATNPGIIFSMYDEKFFSVKDAVFNQIFLSNLVKYINKE